MNTETDRDLPMNAEVAGGKPSTAPDPARATATGRRQRRYARTAGVAAMAVALAVVGVVTVPRLTGAGAPPPAGNGPDAPDRLPTLPTLPRAVPEVDPSVRYLRFGWLPQGHDHILYQTRGARSDNRVELLATPGPIVDEWRGVAVTLFARGATPPAPARPSDSKAEPVIVTPSPGTPGQDGTLTGYSGAAVPEAVLRWHYAPDGWAEVRVAGERLDPAQVAVEVAGKLTIGTTERVKLPFTLTKPLLGLPLTQVQLSSSAGADEQVYHASAAYGGLILKGTSDQPGMAVDVTPYRRSDMDKGTKGYVAPNTTIDGHPAFRDPESVYVFNVKGVNVGLRAGFVLSSVDLYPDLYRQVKLVADPLHWSPDLGP